MNGDLIDEYLARLRASLRTPPDRTALILAGLALMAGYRRARRLRQGRHDAGSTEREERYA